MLRPMCVVATCLVLLAGPAQSSLAQSSNLSPREFVPNLLRQMRIDDISEDPARVIVRTKRLHPDGQSAPGLLIVCDRTRPGHEFLAVHVADG